MNPSAFLPIAHRQPHVVPDFFLLLWTDIWTFVPGPTVLAHRALSAMNVMKKKKGGGRLREARNDNP